MDVPTNIIDLLDLKKFLETKHRCFDAILKQVDDDISQKRYLQDDGNYNDFISIIDTLQ